MGLSLDAYKRDEKINGIIYDMSPSAGFKHSQINGNIYNIIRNNTKRSVCSVSMENLDLNLPDGDYVCPDVMIICDRNQVKNDRYYGIPKFVVETLSPSTAKRDKSIKKDLYERRGVEEYWLISPKEKALDIYYLEEGKYVLKEAYILEDFKEDDHYNADTVITLRALPNVTMTLSEIFEDID